MLGFVFSGTPMARDTEGGGEAAVGTVAGGGQPPSHRPAEAVQYVPPGGRLYRPKTGPDRAAERLRRIEDEMFERAATVVSGALRASEIEGDETEPPAEWVEELGSEKAARIALRAAKDIRLPPSARPGHIDLAKHVMVGIAAARSKRQGEVRPGLQVNVVVAVSEASYPELEVEEVDG